MTNDLRVVMYTLRYDHWRWLIGIAISWYEVLYDYIYILHEYLLFSHFITTYKIIHVCRDDLHCWYLVSNSKYVVARYNPLRVIIQLGDYDLKYGVVSLDAISCATTTWDLGVFLFSFVAIKNEVCWLSSLSIFVTDDITMFG